MTEPTAPADETIKVVCRVRPLNSSEEKAGSKFVLKFPSEETISCGVSIRVYEIISHTLFVIFTGNTTWNSSYQWIQLQRCLHI